MSNQINPTELATRYIHGYKKGGPVKSEPLKFIVNGTPDKGAVKIFEHALKEENGTVRELIVNLLVDIGTKSDTLVNKGALVLRNKEIINTLVEGGLSKPDLGCIAAMDKLRKLTRIDELKPYSEIFANFLSSSPSEDILLLIAKAKTINAKIAVSKLAESVRWKNVEAVDIALAALGDHNKSSKYLIKLEKAAAEKNIEDFIESIKKLSLIGTPETLKAIGEQLRTPLIYEMPGVFRKSLRLNVLDALSYNYPEEYILYPNNIKSEEDYKTAETFCIKKLGVVYNTPEPPFMTYYSYGRLAPTGK